MDRIYIDVLLQIINKFDIISLRAMACTCKKLDIICVDVVRRLVVTPLIDIRKIIDSYKFLSGYYADEFGDRWLDSRGLFGGEILDVTATKSRVAFEKIHPKNSINFCIINVCHRNLYVKCTH